VRVIDAFVDKFDLFGLGFDGVANQVPDVNVKLQQNRRMIRRPSRCLRSRVQSSRRLEREAGRNR
jgi:hypothetical protein